MIPIEDYRGYVIYLYYEERGNGVAWEQYTSNVSRSFSTSIEDIKKDIDSVLDMEEV